jgi:hypothetical protein
VAHVPLGVGIKLIVDLTLTTIIWFYLAFFIIYDVHSLCILWVMSRVHVPLLRIKVLLMIVSVALRVWIVKGCREILILPVTLGCMRNCRKLLGVFKTAWMVMELSVQLEGWSHHEKR